MLPMSVPTRTVGSSVGLGVAGIGALPARIPEGAIVVVPGAADVPLGVGRTTTAQDDASEDSIVAWLRKVVRPGMRVVSICSGALLVARAGLLDGYECTTHHGCTAQLTRAAPAARVRENRLYVEDGERLDQRGDHRGRRPDAAPRGHLWLGHPWRSLSRASWWSICAGPVAILNFLRGWKGAIACMPRSIVRKMR